MAPSRPNKNTGHRNPYFSEALQVLLVAMPDYLSPNQLQQVLLCPADVRPSASPLWCSHVPLPAAVSLALGGLGCQSGRWKVAEN